MEGWDSVDSGATQDFAGGETDAPKLEAAYALGESAGVALGRQQAIKCAEIEGATSKEDGGNLARWDACNNVAAAIRALGKDQNV